MYTTPTTQTLLVTRHPAPDKMHKFTPVIIDTPCMIIGHTAINRRVKDVKLSGESVSGVTFYSSWYTVCCTNSLKLCHVRGKKLALEVAQTLHDIIDPDTNWPDTSSNPLAFESIDYSPDSTLTKLIVKIREYYTKYPKAILF